MSLNSQINDLEGQFTKAKSSVDLQFPNYHQQHQIEKKSEFFEKAKTALKQKKNLKQKKRIEAMQKYKQREGLLIKKKNNFLDAAQHLSKVKQFIQHDQDQDKKRKLH